MINIILIVRTIVVGTDYNDGFDSPLFIDLYFTLKDVNQSESRSTSPLRLKAKAD